MNNHPGRFPGRGGRGTGSYQPASFMRPHKPHPAAHQLQMSVQIPRRSDFDIAQDDRMRIYNKGETLSSNDGIRVKPGPQSPPADGSNTARIIARRRGLDDGSNRSGSVRGRGRGSSAYGHKPKESSSLTGPKESASTSNSRERGGAATVTGAPRTGPPPTVSNSVRGNNRRPTDDSRRTNESHISGGSKPAYKRTSTVSTEGSGRTNGSQGARKRRSTLAGGDVPPTSKQISSSKSTASFHPREDIPGAMKRSHSHDNFNDLVHPRAPPERYDSLPLEERSKSTLSRYNSAPIENNRSITRQQRQKFSDKDHTRISDLTGTSALQSDQQRQKGRMTMMEHQMLELEKRISMHPDQEANNKVSNTQPANRRDMKLYDEILSASDPNIGKVVNGQGGTASTLASDVHSALHMGSFRDKKPKACSTKAVVGLVVLIMSLGGIGAVLYVFQPWTSDDGTEGNESVGLVLAPTTSPKELNVIKAPPDDIEGRCSPSNLPGSLSACLAACLPSACCYPDYSGKSCYDDNDSESKEVCMAYRPYCDVFYNAWEGSTEGVLRAVTDDMMSICTGTGDRTGTDDFIASIPDYTTSTRKLVRGQFASDHKESPRRLQTADDTCSLYCAAAKCCSASIVTDPESFGLNLAPGGVYFDASNGEFVMTNCQQSDDRNVAICSMYEAFCAESFDGEIGRVPVPTGLGSLTTSPANRPSNGEAVLVPLGSASPSLLASTGGSAPTSPAQMEPSITAPSWPQSSPSTTIVTLSPTQNQIILPTAPPAIPIPPAPANKIQQACSDTSSLNDCIGACQDGLCCFTTELGYEWIEPCYAGNEQTCSEYALCLILGQDGDTNDGETDATDNEISVVSMTTSTVSLANTSDFVNNGTDSVSETMTTNATTATQDAGPPVQDLSVLCLYDEIKSNETRLNQCIEACALGRCCGASGEDSCYASYKETCQLYTPCIAAYDILMGGQHEMPPAAAENIDAACSFKSLAQKGTSQCMNICDPGSCCQDNSCLSTGRRTPAIVKELDAICSGYSPCSNLDGMPQPPGNIAQLCSNPSSEGCDAICSKISCCFQGQSSCNSIFGETCNSYRPFCASTSAPTQKPVTNPPTSQVSQQFQPVTSQPTQTSTLQPATNPPTIGATSSENTETTTSSIPPPPSDINELCTTGPSVFCRQVCMPAQCCFETSFQLNCFSKIPLCRDYAACASLYGR